MNNDGIDFTGVDLNSIGEEMITVDEAPKTSTTQGSDAIDLSDKKTDNDKTLEEEKTKAELAELIEVSTSTDSTVAADDKRTSSTPPSTDSGESPSSSSVTTLTKALVEEGILGELPEDFGGNTEDLFELMAGEIESNTKKWIDNLPKPIKDLIENYQEGVPLDRIIQTKSKEIEYAHVTEEVLEKNIELQKFLVREDLKNRGYSKERILKRLKTFEDAEQLEDEATDALKALKTKEAHVQTNLKKEAQQRREAEENLNKKTLDDIRSAVDKAEEIVPGIKMTKKSRNKLYASLTDVVSQNEYGQPMNAVMEKRSKDPLQFELTLHYLNTLGVFDGDFSKLIKTGTTSAVEQLKKQLETTSEFAGKNPGIQRSAESDSVLTSMRQFSNDA